MGDENLKRYTFVSTKHNIRASVWNILRIFCLFFFLILNIFKVNAAVGVTGVFVIFGVSALLEAIFIYLTLPETKDCTLQEIEDYFQVRKLTKLDKLINHGDSILNVIVLSQQSNLLWITRTRTRRDTFVPVNGASA